jgi:hypothetical protein
MAHRIKRKGNAQQKPCSAVLGLPYTLWKPGAKWEEGERGEELGRVEGRLETSADYSSVWEIRAESSLDWAAWAACSFWMAA